jgi:hypothetical protein
MNKCSRTIVNNSAVTLVNAQNSKPQHVCNYATFVFLFKTLRTIYTPIILKPHISKPLCT